MREIRQSGSEGGAGQTNAPSLPLSRAGWGLSTDEGLWQEAGIPPGCMVSAIGSGGVVAVLLNHRLMALNPPGSGGAEMINASILFYGRTKVLMVCTLHPGGISAISRGSRGAPPPDQKG